jgi:hypothetical protein
MSFKIWLEQETTAWWRIPVADVINSGFKYLGSANIGGASQKYFLQSKLNGRKYVFRPGSKYEELRPHQPHADTLASDMASELLHPGEYIPVGTIRPENIQHIEGLPDNLKNKFSKVGGSVQPFIEDAENKDYRRRSHLLSDEDVKKLQKEHVLDWIISNHDSHGNQFIRVNNSLIGIDKSQAMKYFGSDVLSPDYSPNQDYGEDDPIYNYIYRDVQQGKRTIDPMIIKPLLDKIENMPEDRFINMYLPFLQALKTIKKVDIDNVVNELLNRKRNIKQHFSEYYSSMLGEKVSF